MSSTDKKRRRISKACDYCRQKKIKCDGLSPCKNCTTYKVDCCYTHLEKKRAPSKRNSNLKTIKELESRLGRMEHLMEMLADKLDCDPVDNTNSSTDSDSDGSKEDASMSAPEPVIVKPKLSGTASSKMEEQYFGTQSSFSIFSPRGFKWISSKLGTDNNLINPFQELHVSIHQVYLTGLTKWIEPIERSGLFSLPSKSKMQNLTRIFLILVNKNFIYTRLEIDRIFDRFYNGEKLSYSDLLAINSIMALAASIKSDANFINSGYPGFNNDTSIPIAELDLIEENCLANAIFYYHRVSVVGEGINAIQSILLLSCYIESTLLTHSNYMVISTAVRLAQELGLHRKESYYGLSIVEADKRRRVWWSCYFFDRENCLRSGKPPIINDLDVSASLESIVLPILDENLNFKLNFNDLGINESIYNIALKNGFHVYWMIYSHQLATLTSKAYEKLFSANAIKGKKNYEILNTLRDLNRELEDFKNSMDIPLRPGNVIDLSAYQEIFRIHNDGSEIDYPFFFLHYNYFFLLMIINRLAFKMPWSTEGMGHQDEISSNSTIGKSFGTVCLESARVIIKISRTTNGKFEHFTNWTLFYPFSAYITIFCSCIEFPKSKESIDDIYLMIDAATSVLRSNRCKEQREVNQRALKWDFMDIIIRQCLKIAIKVVEANTNRKFDDSTVNKYFNDSAVYDRFKSYQYVNQPSNQSNIQQFNIPPQLQLNHSNTEQTPIYRPQREERISPSISHMMNPPEYNHEIQAGPSSADLNNVNLNLDETFMWGNFNDGSYFHQQIFNLPNFLFNGEQPEQFDNSADINMNNINNINNLNNINFNY